jgi:hypothetical protein
VQIVTSRNVGGKVLHSTANCGNGGHSAHRCLTLRTGLSELDARTCAVDAQTKEERLNMRRKLTWLALIGAGILVAALHHANRLLATPSNSGFKATTLATGTFNEIDVFNQSPQKELPAGSDSNMWLSLQKTKGPSDLYVQSNVWQPGGSTGWHTHPGHSLIIVTSGTLTEYMEDCMAHTYTFVQGQPAPTLIDPGDGHVHIIRNEGSVPATNIAVQLVPYDPNKANRRIDVPAPASCAHIQ